MRRVTLTCFALLTLVLNASVFVVRAQVNDENLITPENAGQLTVVAELPLPGMPLWSPDGSTVAQFREGEGYLYSLYQLTAPPVVVDILGMQRVAYRSDGTLIGWRFTGETFLGDDYMVHFRDNQVEAEVFDLQTQERLARLNVEIDGITASALSADATLIALGDNQNNIHVWNVTTGDQIVTLNRHDFPLGAMSFSHDNRFLVSSDNDAGNWAYLWEVASGSLLREISCDERGLYDVEFSRDDRFVVTGSKGLYPLNILDVEAILDQPDVDFCDFTDGVTHLIDGAVRHFVWQVGFNPEGSIAIASHSFCPFDCSEAGGEITLWDVATGTQLVEWSFPETPTFSFSTDGTLLAMPGPNGIFQLWGVPAM